MEVLQYTQGCFLKFGAGIRAGIEIIYPNDLRRLLGAKGTSFPMGSFQGTGNLSPCGVFSSEDGSKILLTATLAVLTRFHLSSHVSIARDGMLRSWDGGKGQL